MKVSKLKYNPNNPRRISDIQLERLTKSIKDFPEMMELRPMVYDPETMQILGGNQRLEAIRKLDMKEIPDTWAIPANKLTAQQKKEFVLKDNVPLGEWDFAMLEMEFSEFDLPELGIEMSLTPSAIEYDMPEDDDVPSGSAVELGEKWGVKVGQTWALGEHRVFCGDCTVPENMNKLMGGAQKCICFSDPPYGIDVVPSSGKIGAGRRYKKVEGDSDDFDPTWMLDRFEKLILWGANYFSNKLPRGQWIVWDKNVPDGLTFSACELAWCSWGGVRTPKYSITWSGFVREGETGQRHHPTQKPVKLIAEILEDYTNAGDIIVDPYLGSGTTLVACEIKDRICYGAEIDPDYVAVTLQRFQDATGIKPELINV